MRLIVIFLILLSSWQLSFAQEQSTIEYLEVTDGYVYRGWYIEHNEDEVLFETVNGDTLTFQIEEIIQWINPKDFFIYNKGKFHKKNGAFSVIDFYMGGEINGFVMQFNFARGKRITPKTKIGAGLGFNFIGDSRDLADQEFFAELYFYGKYYITNSKVRPFIDAKLGVFAPADFNLFKEMTPGPLVQSGIGLEFAQATVTRFSLKMSFLGMYALRKGNDGSRVLDDISINASLFGLSFNF